MGIPPYGSAISWPLPGCGQRLRFGADRAEIGEFLQHELEVHFGLDPLGLRSDAMAVRVIGWWTSTGRAGDVAGA